MSKLLISLGILCAGLGILYYFAFALPRIQQQQIAEHRQELALKATERAKAETLNQDEKCSKAAEVLFKQNKWDKDTLADFTNHFNSKLNKCFSLTSSLKASGKTLFSFQELIDVHEGKAYAVYAKSTPPGKADYEVKPFVCEMLDKYCHSAEEFDAFVKTYMEN
jgi:hypothetical protein